MGWNPFDACRSFLSCLNVIQGDYLDWFLFVAPEGFLVELVPGTGAGGFFARMNGGAFPGWCGNWGSSFGMVEGCGDMCSGILVGTSLATGGSA